MSNLQPQKQQLALNSSKTASKSIIQNPGITANMAYFPNTISLLALALSTTFVLAIPADGDVMSTAIFTLHEPIPCFRFTTTVMDPTQKIEGCPPMTLCGDNIVDCTHTTTTTVEVPCHRPGCSTTPTVTITTDATCTACPTDCTTTTFTALQTTGGCTAEATQ